MSTDNLTAAIATTSAKERISYVRQLVESIKPEDHYQPGYITKIFQALQVSTHNLQSIVDRNKHDNRQLFVCANIVTTALEQCVHSRLGGGLPNAECIALHEDGYVPTNGDIRSFNPMHEALLERTNLLCGRYSGMVNQANVYFSNLAEVQLVMRIILGEGVQFEDATGNLRTIPPIDMIDLDDAEKNRWKHYMHDFAIGILVMIAKAVSGCFNDQAVQILGSAVPASAFA